MSESLTFEQLELNKDILKVLGEMGFSKPTEIQEQAIPVLTKTGRDFVGQAQTGTGKTAAFVIPLLEKIDFDLKAVQALILAPTRELAIQVENEIAKLGKYTKVKSTCIYGGTGYESQIKSLKRELPHIVVGTPGRVIDLIKKRILKLDDAKFCVLDEADEMLNMGFFDDVQIVLEKFNTERQLMMFSATMPKPIINMINKSFNDPLMVKVESVTLSNSDIDQKYFVVREKHLKEGLARLIESADDVYGLVFCRTKIETREVADDLKKRGLNVEVLNGDMGQNERDLAMRNFKSKKCTLMVCTDVAARGIDINSLTHVFNYGLPRDNESYVHRIGRTGRAGMKGKAYTLMGSKMSFAIKNLERHINQKIEQGTLPSVDTLKKNIVKKELQGAIDIMDAIKVKGEEFKTEDSFSLFADQFDDLSKDELLKLMFVWKFNKEMRRYNNLADIEQVMSSSDSGGGRSGGRRNRTRAPRGRSRNNDSRNDRSASSRSGRPNRSSNRRSNTRSASPSA